MFRSLLTFLIYSMTINSVYAVEPALTFERIDSRQGLSQMNVVSLLQDSRGFLWVGTWDGLNRYDGFEFEVFQHEPDNQFSISNNTILDIFEDHAGFIWVGTNNGLNRFDPNTEVFTRYLHSPADKNSISNNMVLSIAEDLNKNLWIGTQRGGLNQLDSARENFTQFKYRNSPERFSDNMISRLKIDSQYKLWIGHYRGLTLFDPDSKEYRHFENDESDSSSLSYNFVSDILETPDGRIWIGTLNGLNEFIRTTETFVRYQSNGLVSGLIDSAISDLETDEKGNIWIGTRSGLSKFDPKLNTIEHHQHDEFDVNSISENNITTIYTDKDNVLWLGIREGGLNRLPPVARAFNQYRHDPRNVLSLHNNSVSSILEDSRQNLWITTKNGIGKYIPDQKQFNRINSIPSLKEKPAIKAFTSTLELSDGSIWFGSYQGLTKFDKASNSLKTYVSDPLNPNALGENMVTTFLESATKGAWLGTQNKGLWYFNPENESFKLYSHSKSKQNPIGQGAITYLFSDSEESLWIGTQQQGISKLNLETQTSTIYEHNASSQESLSNNHVTAIEKHNANSFWVGTYDGLNLFDKKAQSFSRFTTSDGLASDFITGLAKDPAGNLWISTNQGLSRFYPELGRFLNYSLGDGLAALDFLGSPENTQTGRFFWGSTRGITSFLPSSVPVDENPPKLAITKLLVANKKIEIFPDEVRYIENEKNNHRFTLDRAIDRTNLLELAHSQTSFSFEFAALHFANPKKNQYAYQLEGWDNDWIATDYKNRRATYTNIPAGEYVFRVKASNRDGVWNEEGKSINITILPAPWRTWWAYTLYTAAILGVLLIILTLAYRRKLAEKDKTSAMAIASAKDKLFANVSHEFRTPLTLILSPLDNMIQSAKNSALKYELKLIKRNSQRLLGMVDQLLDLARLQGDQAQHRRPQNISEAVNFIAYSFQLMSQQKDIQLTIEFITSQPLWVSMIPDSLEKLLTNLVANAFKYTASTGRITIRVDKNTKATVLVTVSDTGCGIPQSELTKIFRHFTRLETTASTTPGTGIGLALVKELVDSHNGKIWAESEVGTGSQFFVELPLCQPPEAIQETTDESLPRTRNRQIPRQEFVDLAIADLSSRSADITPKTPNSTTTESETNNSASQNSLLDITTDKANLLIVEDNHDLSDYLVKLLSPYYRCLIAYNGQEGYQLAMEFIPDIIVSDVMMPVMDGYELTSKLKNDEKTSHIPVVLLTARGDKDSRLRGWEEKADEYLTKPFDGDELISRLTNLLSIRSLLRQRYHQIAFRSESTNGFIDRASDIETSGIDNSSTKSPDSRSEDKPLSDLSQIKESAFLKKLERIALASYSNPELKMTDLGSQMAMSDRQFSRKLKAVIGMTPSEYMRRFRLERAKEMLMDGNTIATVYLDVGFSSQSYFGKCFKAQFGQLPSAFKND